MPAESKKQQQFMGAELRRKREGKRTKTKMTAAQLKEYASTKHKGLPAKAEDGAVVGLQGGGRVRSRDLISEGIATQGIATGGIPGDSKRQKRPIPPATPPRRGGRPIPLSQPPLKGGKELYKMEDGGAVTALKEGGRVRAHDLIRQGWDEK